MKRYFVLGFIILCFSGASYAYGSYSAIITPIENSFYGIDYAEEADEQRLERLEETVYGSTQKGDIKTRLNKLKQDISADLIGKEIEAKQDTFADDTPKTTYSNTNNKQQEIYKEDADINYPVVDTMENIVFKKQFKNSDINNRLTKLESEVYNQIYPNEDLYTRVDRLKKTLLIEENPQLANFNDVFGDTNNPNYEDYENYKPQYPRTRGLSSSNANDYSFDDNSYANQDYSKVSDSDLNLAIEKLEKAILKRKHKNDDKSTRLSRIENKLFSTNFEEDDTNTRLNRIATAYQAQKSSKKYMGMDLQEKLSTVMQIGMTVLFILAMVL